MSGPEIIGYIISFLSLLYLIGKNRPKQKEEAAQQPMPSGKDTMQGDLLNEFLKTLEKEKQQREAPKKPVPPPLPPIEQKKIKKEKKKASLSLENYQLTSQIEKRKISSNLESHSLTTQFSRHEERPQLTKETLSSGRSRAGKALDRLTHKNQMVILKEILDKPKSLRPWE